MFKLSVVVLFYSFLVALALADPTARIIGGDTAEPGQFPYQISLRKYGSHICGGSLISSSWILTAAHCVSGQISANGYKVYNANSFSIRAGSINISDGGVIVLVAEVRVHEDYNNFHNDIALLKLAKPLNFSEFIEAIPLAKDEIPVFAKVLISGWGTTQPGGSLSPILKYTILPTIPSVLCSKIIGMNAKNHLCVGHKAGDGVCNGDSGSPAVYNGTLAGVASFVIGGCGSNNPDGFVKVSPYYDWIKRNSGDNLQVL